MGGGWWADSCLQVEAGTRADARLSADRVRQEAGIVALALPGYAPQHGAESARCEGKHACQIAGPAISRRVL